MHKYLQLFRIRHYIKNLFVFAAILFVPTSILYPIRGKLFLIFATFCMASSTIYIFNDLFDLEEDKHHPQKSLHPLASGSITVKKAWILFFVCLGITVLLTLIGSGISAVIVYAYIFLNLVYTLILKKMVIIDVFLVASGYVLRILAGTIGVGISPSHWFVLCTLSISLFLGLGKRRGELKMLNENAMQHRKVLQKYNMIYLDQMMMIMAASTLVFYALYTISPETIKQHQTENMIYTVPFVIFGIFRYMYLIYIKDGGGDPTSEILTDYILQADILLWIFSVVLITKFI